MYSESRIAVERARRRAAAKASPVVIDILAAKLIVTRKIEGGAEHNFGKPIRRHPIRQARRDDIALRKKLRREHRLKVASAKLEAL